MSNAIVSREEVIKELRRRNSIIRDDAWGLFRKRINIHTRKEDYNGLTYGTVESDEPYISAQFQVSEERITFKIELKLCVCWILKNGEWVFKEMGYEEKSWLSDSLEEVKKDLEKEKEEK